MPRMPRKRWNVLTDLVRANDFRTCIELGVMNGRNLHEMLRLNPGLQIWGVDCWCPTPDYWRWPDDSHAMHERRSDAVFAQFPDRAHKVKGFTTEVAHQFPDRSFDLVFIDADHSYEGCKADIEAYLPKVRPGGIIAGHDYNADHVKYGDLFQAVIRAVDEAFGAENVTVDADHVWWVRV